MAELQTFTLPVFPLGSVLYPGGLLPLRIFEPRYLAMVRECLREKRGFAVFPSKSSLVIHVFNLTGSLGSGSRR